jgi:hypothetical protein
MAGDLQGPRTWDKHRLRTGVPAHRDQSTIYGGDHAATSDVADLLRLHQYPVANLDHDRLLWMVTKPGHPKCPHDRRLHSRRPVAMIVLAIQSSHPAACDTTAHAESIAVGDLLAMLQRLPRDAEQLATEPGCVRGCQPPEGPRQADQATWTAARLLPGGESRMPTRAARERFAWSWLTRPPGIRGFALCLPLTERGPLSLRGPRVVEHDRTRVGGRQRERSEACG